MRIKKNDSHRFELTYYCRTVVGTVLFVGNNKERESGQERCWFTTKKSEG